ncbi:MAG TPA: hypothetical protein VJC21_01220, partial [Candidatus Nanoarchaeia archaeon]|nr:hypothetical protein [Candidatus Nanoarchaeia archaeon]
MLIFVFFVLVIALGLALGVWWGNQYFGIILAVVIGFIYFLISYFSGTKMILTMTRAQEATKPKYTTLINTVEGLTIAAGLPQPPKIYVIQDSALNAFASGRDP